jgi:hypothetical protein
VDYRAQPYRLRAGNRSPSEGSWVPSAGWRERSRGIRCAGAGLKVPDFVIAVLEDLVAVAAALFVVTRF